MDVEQLLLLLCPTGVLLGWFLGYFHFNREEELERLREAYTAAVTDVIFYRDEAEFWERQYRQVARDNPNIQE